MDFLSPEGGFLASGASASTFGEIPRCLRFDRGGRLATCEGYYRTGRGADKLLSPFLVEPRHNALSQSSNRFPIVGFHLVPLATDGSLMMNG
jgi:hypothetical protein